MLLPLSKPQSKHLTFLYLTKIYSLSHAFLAKSGQTKVKRKKVVAVIIFLTKIIAITITIIGVGGDSRVRKTIVSLNRDVVLKLARGSQFIE